MKAYLHSIVVLSLLCIALPGCCYVRPHLRQSVDGIRQDLLADTPLGTHIGAVRRALESSDRWGQAEISYTDSRGTEVPDVDGNWVVLGTQTMHVTLGEYCNILPFPSTFVTAEYAFDDHGALVAIVVHKFRVGT